MGAHAIELNICHTTTDFLRLAKDIKKFLFALAVHVTSEKIIIHSAGDVKRRSKKKQISATYDVRVRFREKTEEINRSIGKLSALTGAFQIHEVLIGSDLC